MGSSMTRFAAVLVLVSLVGMAQAVAAPAPPTDSASPADIAPHDAPVAPAATASTDVAPLARGGVLDLRGVDLDRVGVIDLDGEWQVYWRRLYTPQDFAPAGVPDATPPQPTIASPPPESSEPAQPALFTMPATWNGWQYHGQPVGGFGYATFRLRILVPPDTARLALWIPNASTAYRLWANGEDVADSGSPGRTRETSRPHYVINTADVSVENGELDLLLQVSNFHHRRGGMWKSIKLGTPAQIERLDTTETLYDFLLLGSFLAALIYNVLLYTTRRSRGGGDAHGQVPLLMVVIFAATMLRVLVTGQILATRLIPALPWGVLLRLEYLSVHVVFATFVWIADRTYPRVIPRPVVWGLTAFVVANSMVVLAFPVLVYSRIVTGYNIVQGVVLLLLTVRFATFVARGHREAWAMLGTIAIFFLITLTETAHYRELVLSRDFAPLGFFVALFGGGHIPESLYLLTTIGGLAVMLLVFNLFVFRVSERFLQLETRLAPLDPEVVSARFGVSPRESEILCLVARGLSNKEIGGRLEISEGTVKNHLHRAMRKVGVGNRTEIAIRLRYPD